MDLSIVVPCYNEVDNVGKIQEELLPVAAELAKNQEVELILVDDGSIDGTGPALRATFGHGHWNGVAIKVEHHPVNQGLGAAIRTGLTAASGQVIVTTDSDGTYQFTEIPALLALLTPEIDIVTASPYHPSGNVDGVPAYRLALSRGSSTMYRLLTSRQVHTYTALFRAYRRHVIENVPFESNGFLAGTELLVNAMRMGFQVAEYPTVLRSRVLGVSKAKLARTIQAHLNFQVRTLMPWQPYGTIIRGSSVNAYLYASGNKRLFPSPEIFLSHGYQWQQIVQVNDDYLSALPEGPEITFRNGTLVQGSRRPVYIIEDGRKRVIPSDKIFNHFGYRSRHIIEVSDDTLAGIKTGSELSLGDKHPNGSIIKGTTSGPAAYLLENGQKRWFPSPQTFMSWGYKWDQIISVPDEQLAAYPLGLPVEPQSSFYLKDIQEAIQVNIKPESLPDESLFAVLPQLIQGIAEKAHLRDLPVMNLGKKASKLVF